ncbi:MAG: Nif3-like dinuclear metal center hexameric protein [Muribaculaceae bacterium]|nr:Nif3-like dinuclear metal center hexameric protein [Muribaculaceae bacterium]
MLNGNIISVLEDFAPVWLQEQWDNSGLQCGSRRAECTGVLLCVDVTPAVVAEAVERGCNLIISHHPLLFKGVKRLTPDSPQKEALMAAVKADITVFSCHTPLDSARGGVSVRMLQRLGARFRRVLSPLKERKARITVTVVPETADAVRLALLDLCSPAATSRNSVSVSVHGQQMAYPLESADDFINSVVTDTVTVSAVVDAETVDSFRGWLEENLLQAEFSSCKVTDVDYSIGLGAIGTFDTPLPLAQLLERIKDAFSSPQLRASLAVSDNLSADEEMRISRIAVCGGSGAEFIPAAMRCGAQLYLTSDVKYHDFVDYGTDFMLVDIGHFNSEECTKDIFYDVITKKIPNFAVYKSDSEKNPIIFL